MQINTKLKYSALFIVFIMCAFNLFFPLTIVKADEEEDPLRCTYGVYSADEHGIIESDVDYYETMNFNGFCEGVYQYYLDSYPSTTFIDFTEFKHYVSSYIPLTLWEAFTLNGYFINTYCNDDTIIILAQHQPEETFPAEFSWSIINEGADVHILLGTSQDTTYFIRDNGKMFGYTAPAEFQTSVDTVEYNTQCSVANIWGVYSNDNVNALITSLNNKQYYGFMFIMHLLDIPNLTFTFGDPWCICNFKSYRPLGCFNETLRVNNSYPIDISFNYDPVLTTFPTWITNVHFFDCYSITQDYSFISKVYLLTQVRPTFSRDYDMSPIIASNYTYVPLPSETPTSIPIPTITLYPTPTPYVVETMEGVGQMFTLFTRKYTFNINGVDIGIRPFYLVLACFIVGSIFTMVQGGNKS